MFLFRFVKWIIPHPKSFIRRQPVPTVNLFELLLLLNFFLFFFHNCNRLNQCLFFSKSSLCAHYSIFAICVYYWTCATVSLFELLLLLNFFLFFFHNCKVLNCL